MDLRYTSYAIISRQPTPEVHRWHERLQHFLQDTHPTLTPVAAPDADLLIVLGGDGTLLDALRQERDADLLALNTGHVGFLCTDRDQTRFLETVEATLRGELIPMSIPVMEIEHVSGERTAHHRAINDLLLERTMTWSTFRVELLDGVRTHLLKEIRGSGICLCSAIGSTSPMAAHFQAPRLDPALPAFYFKGENDTIPPTQGFVIGTTGERTLRITLTKIEPNLGLPEDQRLAPALYLDGLYGGLLALGDRIDIRYAAVSRTLLRRADDSPYDRVRQLL